MPARKVSLSLTENGYKVLSALAILQGQTLEEFVKASLDTHLKSEGYNEVVDSKISELLKRGLFEN